MTKKSDSRLLRDAAKARDKKALENNTCWDDLRGTYTSCAGLLHQHTNLSSLARRKDLIACVADTKTLVDNLGILANDLRQLNEDLQKLYALHSHKSGGSTDPDEVLSSIQVFEQYNLFMERHDAVVMPTVFHILEQFNQAETILAQKNQDSANAAAAEAVVNKAQQPVSLGDLTSDANMSDVLDVEVREVAPQTAAE